VFSSQRKLSRPERTFVWNDCDYTRGEGSKQLDDGIGDTLVSSAFLLRLHSALS
jgi:hypothetical protein